MNLTVSLKRPPGWPDKVRLHNPRFWLFVTTGMNTIKLAVPPRERG